MGIKVDWDNDEQTVILYRFDGSWSWDDLYNALDRVKAMSASVDHQVDAIIDFSKASYLPSGAIFSFNGHKQAQKLASKASEARGQIVIAGAGMFIRSVYDAFRALDNRISRGVHFTDTLADARAYLVRQQQKAIS